MGVDFQFIAYGGRAQTDAQLADLIRAQVPSVPMFRHAPAPLERHKDLHCVALYNDATNAPLPDADDATVPPDAPLSSLVQAAWKATLTALRGDRSSPGNTREVALTVARALSRVVGVTYWLCQGDHSGVGGYAQFQDGKLVAQAGEDDVWLEGEEYVSVPVAMWSKALGAPLEPETVFFAAFPEEDGPPMCVVAQRGANIPFDPARHEVSFD